ncbi:MAG: T9SS type A sorting domain-containing protein [Candidatus Eisenbacteria bacterium]
MGVMRVLLWIPAFVAIGTAMVVPGAASSADETMGMERELRATSGEHRFVSPGEDRRDLGGEEVIVGSVPVLTDEEAALVSELGDARRRGDEAVVRRLEGELAALRGLAPEFIAGQAEDISGTVVLLGGEESGLTERWTDDVVVLGDTSYDEGNPSMATDDAGNRYAAIEVLGDTWTYIWIRRSTDNGQTWYLWVGLWSPGHVNDFTNPSIAIGEGNEDWLLLTYVEGGTRIKVWRFSLSDPSVSNLMTVEDDVLGVSHPRIVTDTNEYSVWYGYLVWNAGWLGLRQDMWMLRFSRTLNYGASWTAPTSIDNYCELFHQAADAHPDIDFGRATLHVVYDDFPPGCAGPNRDVFIRSSTNYGGSWGSEVRLTTSDMDEFDPRVAAVKSDTIGTVMVGLTRDWGTDDDVLYRFSQNGGASWGTYYCLACTEDDEHSVDLTTSFYRGMVHAAFWHEYDVVYGGTEYHSLAPGYWTILEPVNEGNWASAIYSRPTIEVNPTLPSDLEAGIAWTDYRNPTYDVYFDAAEGIDTEVGEALPVVKRDPTGSSYPNPARGATTIGYALPAPERVTMRIFDVSGRLVRVLVDGVFERAGEHEILWDGKDTGGRSAGPGVYFCRMETGSLRQTKRIVVVH